jgi:hypothetical protein
VPRWFRLRPESIVFLDLRATRVAASVGVTAVAHLAETVRARGGVLRVVRSRHTPSAIVEAAGAPVRIPPAPLDLPHPRRPHQD